MNEATTKRLAEVAKAMALRPFHGAAEGGTSNLGPLVRPFPGWTPEEADGLWCAAFVYFCCREAGFVIPIRPDECRTCHLAGCVAWEEFAAGDPRIVYHKGLEGFVPEAGDIVLYDRVFENREHDHMGIVLERRAHAILAAEGNVDNRSAIVERSVDGHIRGFIRLPDGYRYGAGKRVEGMDLSEYDQRYVRVRTVYGDTVEGLARYEDREYLESEWGGKGDGLFIGEYLIRASQAASVEEITVHGTAELCTERLTLRRFTPEDAEPLRRLMGAAPGGDRYATPETARETVRRIIDSYRDEHFYAWVMDWEDVPVGTVEARDRRDGWIEVGLRVAPDWRGRGLGAEALGKVLGYLTENEGIPLVTARCAAGDAGAREAFEQAGMRPAGTEGDGGEAIYAYRREDGTAAGIRQGEGTDRA